MSKKELLHKLYAGLHLNSDEAERLMLLITQGELLEIEIAAILMFYKTNSISTEELNSYRNVLLDKCLKFQIPFSAIDVCGTGGDEKDTFNISTLSALVTAACGYKVVKHGNYGVSSVCGSSNILEYFGYKFTNNSTILLDQLQEHNICFLHAPLFHPALKYVAPVRKTLGTKTIFNLLGPLVNPCNISHQLIGVNNLEVMRQYNYLLQRTDLTYTLVHSIDGYDEISLTNKFKVVSKRGEELIHPNEIGSDICEAKDLLSGGTIEEAAKLFLNVLNNSATLAQLNAVIINSSYAIKTISGKPLEKCIAEAKEAIESKKALHLFKNLTDKKYEYVG